MISFISANALIKGKPPERTPSQFQPCAIASMPEQSAPTFECRQEWKAVQPLLEHQGLDGDPRIHALDARHDRQSAVDA
jgi:hypothetical protein